MFVFQNFRTLELGYLAQAKTLLTLSRPALSAILSILAKRTTNEDKEEPLSRTRLMSGWLKEEEEGQNQNQNRHKNHMSK